ncbi:MAG: PilW family protein [Candidatus Polarisedimenticolia bacterium]
MSTRRRERGFSLVEILVAMTLVAVAFAAAAPLLIQSAQTNKVQQMKLAAQADARNCMTLIVNTLRTAGWDPRNNGFAAIVLDPDPNTDNFITANADLLENNNIDDDGESVTIRHFNNTLEWRRVADPNVPFVVLAENVTNDADGDGTAEPLFTPDDTTNPQRITIKITTRSAEPDPRTRQYLRYTVESDVYLRGGL